MGQGVGKIGKTEMFRGVCSATWPELELPWSECGGPELVRLHLNGQRGRGPSTASRTTLGPCSAVGPGVRKEAILPCGLWPQESPGNPKVRDVRTRTDSGDGEHTRVSRTGPSSGGPLPSLHVDSRPG